MKELNIKNSSNLSKATWDDQSQNLLIEFKNNTTYKYFGVSETLWNQFAKTINEDGSAGQFFHANIKKLPCEKVR